MNPVDEGRASHTIVRQVRIAARPATVFTYLVDPAKYARWMGQQVSLDARAGGIYRVDFGDRGVVRGEFLEVVLNERVVFTWGWETGNFALAPSASTVEITLEPDGDGTVVRLTHRSLPTDVAREAHDQGWQRYLARLALAALGQDPGPDRMDAHG